MFYDLTAQFGNKNITFEVPCYKFLMIKITQPPTVTYKNVAHAGFY